MQREAEMGDRALVASEALSPVVPQAQSSESPSPVYLSKFQLRFSHL